MSFVRQRGDHLVKLNTFGKLTTILVILEGFKENVNFLRNGHIFILPLFIRFAIDVSNNSDSGAPDKLLMISDITSGS